MKGRFTCLSLLVALCLLGAAFASVQAQSNIFTDRVYVTLQTKCAATCHNASNLTGNLDLSGTPTEVHAKIVGVTPSNPVAQGKGQKLIYPGHPYKSFLLLKANNGLIHAQDGGVLSPEEGTTMPPYGSSQPLTNVELEMMRQWIYAGATANGDGPTGYTVNQQAVLDYYADGGLPVLARPAPPATGFQIHLGPLFLQPNQEVEYDVKYDINMPANYEVNRLNLKMNDESHHFILYKFDNATIAEETPHGLLPVNIVSTAVEPSNTSFVAGWQDDVDIRLPAGTAFRWDASTVLSLNYHVRNYSQGLVMPAELYLNVHTQPYGTAIKEMKSDLVLYNSSNLWPPAVSGFFTLPPGQWTLTENVDNGPQMNLWMLTSHTHKYGTDYDLWVQTPSGDKGEQIFEGFMDYTYCNCNVGYYDWEHPPVKYYEPYYTVPANTGLIHEAKFNNTSNSWVTFGLTTNDEMMLYMVQYTEGEPIPFVGITNIATSYCVDDIPNLALYPATGGVLAGPGVQDGQFIPALAGIGEHEITYTAEGLTATYSVFVNPAPAAPVVNYSDGFLGISGTYDSYQWYFNGNAITGATGLFYSPQAPGNYTIQVSLNGCTVSSEPYNFSITGLDANPTSGSEVYVFPNPYQNQVNITYILQQTSMVKVEVFNTLGQLVTTLTNQQQVPAQYTYQFSAKEQGFPAGVYFVKIDIDGKTTVKKVVEQ
ncbi:MAG TPA: T9SS type A sorting domain-containing protein [Chitinophagales bacterium]|nr:T9SS type A sorting domain-containing protein [Chitinophagales bacterium]HRK28750.1 T9SS type A sorting domain-containing protein [Chitinophagales bacterium]